MCEQEEVSACANSNEWVTILHPYIKITFMQADSLSPHSFQMAQHECRWLLSSTAFLKWRWQMFLMLKPTHAAPHCQHLCCCSRSQYQWPLYTAGQGGIYKLPHCGRFEIVRVEHKIEITICRVDSK